MVSLNMVLQFIIAGTVVVGATWLSRFIAPKWGALVAAAPHVLKLSIIFVLLETNTQLTQSMIVSAAWFLVPVFAFLGMVYFLISRTSLFYSLFAGYVVYFAMAFAINYFFIK